MSRRLLLSMFAASCLLSCKAELPPTPPAHQDAPPDGKALMGGRPQASAGKAAGTPDFSKAIQVSVTWDAARSAVVAKVHLEPGFHAYGPGEETGKPLSMDITPGAWTVKELKVPPGTPKDLGELGKSVVFTGDVEVLGVLVPGGDAKAPVAGKVNYQVCSDTSCDRPRSQPFSLLPG